MSGFDNEVLYANNVDFSGGSPVTGKMVSNGQLLIGSTVAPNIRVGTITSSDGTITVTNGAGTIDLKTAAAVGDVDGPASSTDNAVARWDGITGKLLQDSIFILQDSSSGSTITNTITQSAAGAAQELQLSNSSTSGTARAVYRALSASSTGDSMFQASTSTGSGAVAAFGVDTNVLNGSISFSSSGTNISAFSPTNDLAVWNTTMFKINRGFALKLTETAVSYGVAAQDSIIAVTDNSAARTITLPSTGVATGQVYTIKDAAGTAGSVNAISVVVSGGVKTIDGLTSQSINSDYGSITVYYNGTNYFIV